MNKPTKSRKNYKCYKCKSEISKGSYYIRKSIRMGDSGLVGHGGNVHTWEPYYVTVKVCVTCNDSQS